MTKEESKTTGNRPAEKGNQPSNTNNPNRNQPADQSVSKDRDMYAEGTPDSSRQFGEMSGPSKSNQGSSGTMPGKATPLSDGGQGTRPGQGPPEDVTDETPDPLEVDPTRSRRPKDD